MINLRSFFRVDGKRLIQGNERAMGKENVVALTGILIMFASSIVLLLCGFDQIACASLLALQVMFLIAWLARALRN